MVERKGAGRKSRKKSEKTDAPATAERSAKAPSVDATAAEGPAEDKTPDARSAIPATDGADPALAPRRLRKRGRARLWGALAFAAIIAGAVLYGLWPMIVEQIGPGAPSPAPIAEQSGAPGLAEAPPPAPGIETSPSVAPAPAGSAEDDAARAALDARISKLERALAEALRAGDDGAAAGLAARLDRLEAGLADATSLPGGEGVADLAARLEAMEGRLDAIGAAPGATLDDELAAGLVTGLADAWAELRGLVSRLERLEVELAARPGPEVDSLVFLLALGQLRDNVDRGDPFAAELATLGRLLGDDTALTGALEAHAATGVPTHAMLRARFETTARAVVTAAIAPEGASWVDETLQKLAGIVSVRRTGGDVEGDSAQSRIARAEARLAGGELAAALGELEGLNGAAAAAAAPWLADARARLAVDAALTELNRVLIDRLGGAPAGP